MSAFQSFLIFGEIENQSYKVYLLFSNYDLEILFRTLVKIGEYFAEDEKTTPSNLIKYENTLAYAWKGRTLVEKNVEFKIVEFFVSNSNDNIKSSFFIRITNFRMLIKALKTLYFSTLQLNSDEKYFLNTIALNNYDDLSEFKTNKHLLWDFIKKNRLDEKKHFEFYQLFIFYFDEIDIIAKLNLLSE